MTTSKENEEYRLDLPVELDVKQLIEYLNQGRTGGPRMEEMVTELADTACKLARPRAVYRKAHSRVIDNTTTDIDGAIFTSKVLSKLLASRDTIFPFIATIGKELDELSMSRGEMMKGMYLELIKTLILANAVVYLTELVKEKHNMPQAAMMNPGSLEDWPIKEQELLFGLFNNVEECIGVTLTAGNVMKPTKSGSGIVFLNESGFIKCMLCPKLDCPGRHAEYDPRMVKEYLG